MGFVKRIQTAVVTTYLNNSEKPSVTYKVHRGGLQKKAHSDSERRLRWCQGKMFLYLVAVRRMTPKIKNRKVKVKVKAEA